MRSLRVFCNAYIGTVFDKDSIRSMSGIPRSARRLALNDEGERGLFVVILKLNVQFPSYPSFRGAAALPLLSRGYDVATWNPLQKANNYPYLALIAYSAV